MQTTLVILKPSAVQRNLVGQVIAGFERKGLQIVGIKMVHLTESILEEHYSHLRDKPIFRRIADSMMVCPVIVMAIRGLEAVDVVRSLTGPTNGRYASPGTIRGDLSNSVQENIVQASDSLETANIELNRFFNKNEIFNYEQLSFANIYAVDEV